MKPIQSSKTPIALVRLPTLSPQQTKAAKSSKRRGSLRIAFSTPPMKSQKWVQVAKSPSSDSLLQESRVFSSEPNTHRMRLPPLERLEAQLLPPTLPNQPITKIPRLFKRFDNMDETLTRIPCEDFMSALLSREPCFDSALIHNWEKIREKCKCDDAVTEYAEEEDVQDSPYVYVDSDPDVHF